MIVAAALAIGLLRRRSSLAAVTGSAAARGNTWAKLRRSVSLAVKSLWLHKLRSFLSVLGIIIGIASVIALMAFGEGSMQDALDDIKRQGATNIIVRSVKPPDDSATVAASVRHHLRADQEATSTGSSTFGDSIVRIVPLRVFPTEARYLERMLRTPASIGTDARLRRRQQVRAGRRPVPDRRATTATATNYCVLGSEAADKLFPFEDPLGKIGPDSRPRLHRHRRHRASACRPAASGGSQAAEEFNKDIYIPFSTTVARFGA